MSSKRIISRSSRVDQDRKNRAVEPGSWELDHDPVDRAERIYVLDFGSGGCVAHLTH
jgi:hypothetical protein